MTLPLQGQTVVVTRPESQAADLVVKLEQAGAGVIVFPTLSIEPLPLTSQDKSRIMDLDRYDFVMCVSANAARLGLEALADYWPQWPDQQQWIAVGPATGAAMENWQLKLKVAQQGSTSETLLSWPELQNLQEKRVLILRGQSGRETLANTLRERGAQVDYLELYQRALPDVDASRLITPLAAGQRLNITVTSGDGLRNLMALVVEQLSHLQNCPLVVVSGRLAQFAKEQGFRQVIEAKSASGDDIVQALAGLESN